MYVDVGTGLLFNAPTQPAGSRGAAQTVQNEIDGQGEALSGASRGARASLQSPSRNLLG